MYCLLLTQPCCCGMAAPGLQVRVVLGTLDLLLFQGLGFRVKGLGFVHQARATQWLGPATPHDDLQGWQEWCNQATRLRPKGGPDPVLGMPALPWTSPSRALPSRCRPLSCCTVPMRTDGAPRQMPAAQMSCWL